MFVERFLKVKFYEFSVNLIVLGYGCGIGWVSLALPLLKSDETPLTTGPFSKDEVSWIGSILSMGSLTGNLIFGTLVNFYGAKTCLLLTGALQTVDFHSEKISKKRINVFFVVFMATFDFWKTSYVFICFTLHLWIGYRRMSNMRFVVCC